MDYYYYYYFKLTITIIINVILKQLYTYLISTALLLKKIMFLGAVGTKNLIQLLQFSLCRLTYTHMHACNKYSRNKEPKESRNLSRNDTADAYWPARDNVHEVTAVINGSRNHYNNCTTRRMIHNRCMNSSAIITVFPRNHYSWFVVSYCSDIHEFRRTGLRFGRQGIDQPCANTIQRGLRRRGWARGEGLMTS